MQMDSKIYIGQLDRRVTINKFTAVKDSVGESDKQETLVITTWAKVQFKSGNESVDGQVISLNVRDYVIRYVQEIYDEGEKYSVVDALDNGTFDINHIEMLGRKEYLVLKTIRRE